MNQLFTRLYLQFFLSLLMVMGMAALAVYLLADIRLQRYAEDHLSPLADLMQDGWSDLTSDQQEDWLALVSGLTGTSWQRIANTDTTGSFSIDHAQLTDPRVHASIRLDSATLISAEITDWQSLEQGYGWLFLDAISREPSDRREARFIALRNLAPWDIERVTLDAAELSPLALRQLASGQSVRAELQTSAASALYFPAGDNRAVRFGPLKPYSYLSVSQWLSVVGLSLALLSVSFLLWVKPLDRRFRQLFESVDRISSTRDSVQLPSEASDELGQLAGHIERMAISLINQVEQNRQLNQAVSHDLKTPLARIRFSLELLEIEPENPYRHAIERDIDRLVQLTDELLMYHQLQSPSEHKEAVELIALTRDCLIDIDREQSLTMDLPDPPVLARIQSRHWVRLLDNLIGNAVQYGQGRIHLRISTADRGLRLCVEDNGPGLTEEQFERLCLPFQRLESHRNLNQNNHGLGLALIAATAQHYHGRFHCQSSTLGGAAMIVDFPGDVLAHK